MNKLFVVYTFFVLPLLGRSSIDWNFNFSLGFIDDEVTVSSTIMVKPNSGLNLYSKGKAFIEFGLKLGYNKRYFCDVFSKVACYKFSQTTSILKNDIKSSVAEIQKGDKNIKLITLEEPNREMTFEYNAIHQEALAQKNHRLDVTMRYSLLTSELSLGILPVYKGNKEAYIKNILLFNFLQRNFKRSTTGEWSFVGYKSAEGYSSLKDFLDDDDSPRVKTLLKNPLEQSAQIIAGAFMADIGNSELKDFFAVLWNGLETGESVQRYRENVQKINAQNSQVPYTQAVKGCVRLFRSHYQKQQRVK